MTAHCTACGTALVDTGRFCTSCGHPRPDAPEVEAPPAVGQQPGPARYPLYVESAPQPQVDDAPDWWQPTETVTAPEPATPPPASEPATAPAPTRARTDAPRAHRRRGPLLLLALFLVSVLCVGAAAWLGSRDAGLQRDAPTAGTQGEPRPLVALAEAFVPAQDDDSVDIATGGTTTYDAANLLDDDPTTAWRVRGAAVGTELVLRFDTPVTLTSVGLVNGYAKTSVADGTTYDLYAGGRRITAVTWLLGGAPPVRQELDESREPQVLDVSPVTTDTVRLRIESVSEPGAGPAARDTTAISDVVLEGLVADDPTGTG